MLIRIRHATARVASALTLVSANALAQPAPPSAAPPAPAPAPIPAPPSPVAGDPDFDDEGELEVTLGPTSASAYSCSQAAVYVRQRANIERCWSDASGAPALAAAALALTEQVCQSQPLPFDLEWAEQDVAKARAAYAQAVGNVVAKQALARAVAQLERSKSTRGTSDALLAAFDSVVDSATPQDFVEMLESEPRRAACRDVARALRDAQKPSAEANERAIRADAEAQLEPDRAHASDLLRKASTSITAITGTSAEVEHAGAPDTVVLAIMSALGAGKETSGSNVVMTLNLASIAVQDQRKRLELAPPVRNLFLRVTAPLEATEPKAVTGATEGADTAEGEPEVKRLNLVLGTSLLDSSDPRLKPNRECYARVVDYFPPASTDTKESERIEKRTNLFDVCNRRAAYEQRLALRAGISLLTDQNSDDPNTRPELYAGALVYAPAPFLYTNLLYQAIVEPSEIHVFGAGLSIGTNVGGRDSGVDSWSRVGLDTLFLVARSADAEEWDWEWRVVPTARFKIGDTVSQLGIGPRLLGSGDGGLFATIALSYDVDALMDPLLTTPATPGASP
jgi:hypothetical protein